jgi:pilus assembly protein Flp/PilA
MVIIHPLSIGRFSGELIMLYMPREEGQGLVEYALILVLVAVVVIVILALLGPAIGNIFSNLVKNL